MSLRGRQAGARSQVSMDRYLIATIGGVQLAFPAEAVDGLLTLAESGAEGELTVQGHAYLPVDLGNRLGLARDEESVESRVILLAQGATRACVRVARVQGLMERERRQVLPLPHQFRGAERSWYVGLLPLGDGVSVVLRASWLFQGTTVLELSGSGPQRQPLLTNPEPVATGGRTSC